LTRKRTKSLDSANWTGSLGHAGGLYSVNPKYGAYNRYSSVDSDIVNYVNREELDTERMRTIKKTRRSRPRTPNPPPFPQDRLPDLGVGTIDDPLPHAPLMANVGMEMMEMAAPPCSR
jgi:hypothetical protein